MQAIETKYLCPTQSRGPRMKAACQRGNITIPYDAGLDEQSNHVAAADALVAKFAKEDAAKYGSCPSNNPWLKPRSCGALFGTYAHVFIS